MNNRNVKELMERVRQAHESAKRVADDEYRLGVAQGRHDVLELMTEWMRVMEYIGEFEGEDE